MSDNVVPIGAHVETDQIKGTEPIPEIVALLRQTLAEAERGEIIGCAVVGVTGSNTLVMRYHANCSATAMLGAGCLMYEQIKALFLENSMQSYQDETPPA